MILGRPTVIVPASESRHLTIYIPLEIGSTAISSPDTNRASTWVLRSQPIAIRSLWNKENIDEPGAALMCLIGILVEAKRRNEKGKGAK